MQHQIWNSKKDSGTKGKSAAYDTCLVFDPINKEILQENRKMHDESRASAYLTRGSVTKIRGGGQRKLAMAKQILRKCLGRRQENCDGMRKKESGVRAYLNETRRT